MEYHQTYLATISGNCDILRLLFEKGAKPQNNNKSVRKSIKMKNSESLRILLLNESKKYGDKLDHVVENTGETFFF